MNATLGRKVLVVMKQPLPRPTVELVKAEGDKFDQEPSTRLGEEALGQLRTQFPRNRDLSHVLLKVLALNKLYSARCATLISSPSLAI
jgi:hypothetical protein